jgi:hypothetical protein
MRVATFRGSSPHEESEGLDFAEGQFVLLGSGPTTREYVARLDAAGELAWVNEDMRALALGSQEPSTLAAVTGNGRAGVLRVGTYVDGRPLTYCEATRQFAVGRWPVTYAQVRHYDSQGHVSWASMQWREWARSQTAPASPSSGEGTSGSTTRVNWAYKLGRWMAKSPANKVRAMILGLLVAGAVLSLVVTGVNALQGTRGVVTSIEWTFTDSATFGYQGAVNIRDVGNGAATKAIVPNGQPFPQVGDEVAYNNDVYGPWDHTVTRITKVAGSQ